MAQSPIGNLLNGGPVASPPSDGAPKSRFYVARPKRPKRDVGFANGVYSPTPARNGNKQRTPPSPNRPHRGNTDPTDHIETITRNKYRSPQPAVSSGLSSNAHRKLAAGKPLGRRPDSGALYSIRTGKPVHGTDPHQSTHHIGAHPVGERIKTKAKAKGNPSSTHVGNRHNKDRSGGSGNVGGSTNGLLGSNMFSSIHSSKPRARSLATSPNIPLLKKRTFAHQGTTSSGDNTPTSTRSNTPNAHTRAPVQVVVTATDGAEKPGLAALEDGQPMPPQINRNVMNMGQRVRQSRSKQRKKDQRRYSDITNDNDRLRALSAADSTAPSIASEELAFDFLDHSKWRLEELLDMESYEEFSAFMNPHSKTDLTQLCWDLLRTNEKCNQLVSMVTSMNQDLHQQRAFRAMMTTCCAALDATFASIWTVEDDRRWLRCLYTSQGETNQEVCIPCTHGTALPAKVFQSGRHQKRSLNENTADICPEFHGFGYVYILGVPIRDTAGTMIGILMVYRDRTIAREFDVGDRRTAGFLTSIAANTLKNVRLLEDAEEQKRDSARVLGIIDEMSGDVTSNTYQSIIRKLLRKIRGLVTCQHLDFWTITGPPTQKLLTCQISQNVRLQDLQIPVSDSTILGQVALTGVPVKIDTARLDTRYTQQQLAFSKGDSILVIPVRMDSEPHPIALIQAINKIPSQASIFGHTRRRSDRVLPFNENDKRILQTLAKSASVIIRNSILFEATQGERRKNMALVQILRALQQKHDVSTMLHDACVCIHAALDCERVSIWFTDGNGQLDSLTVEPAQTQLDETVEQLFASVAKYAAEENLYINTPNVYQDEQLWMALRNDVILDGLPAPNALYRYTNASVLCVPIATSDDNTVGVIQAMYKRNGEPFTDLDESIVDAVSSEVAHTIARNISQLCLQRYIEKGEDMPLDVIDYFLTGSHDQADSFAVPAAGQSSSIMDGSGGFQSGSQQMNNMDVPNGGALAVIPSGGDTDDIKQEDLIFHFGISNYLMKDVSVLNECDFDACKYERPELCEFITHALQSTHLLVELNVNMHKLCAFLNVILDKYRDNPFHNPQHGFFVFQFIYYFVTHVDVTSFLRKLDIFAILIAGLCHDVEHPGNDNQFETDTDSELSRVYNMESVLENLHVWSTLSTLRIPEYNFIEHWPVAQQKDFKKLLVKSILTTDMSHHMETIEWLHELNKQKMVDKLINNKDMKEMERKSAVTKICQCIVHLGDLSPQTYPWPIAKEWEKRVATEFFQQTIKEENLGLTVREWMAKTDIPTRYKNQHFFVVHVLKPLWEPSVAIFPALNERLDQLMFNSKKYIDTSNKAAAKKQKTQNANV